MNAGSGFSLLLMLKQAKDAHALGQTMADGLPKMGRQYFLTTLNFLIDCALDCSPEAFNLITDRLKKQQPVLIRLYACEVVKGERYVADHFNILTLESISGPKYFIERYLKYVTKEGGLSPENFASLKESFRNAIEK